MECVEMIRQVKEWKRDVAKEMSERKLEQEICYRWSNLVYRYIDM